MFTRLYFIRLTRLLAVLVALSILAGGIMHEPAAASPHLASGASLDSADLRPASNVHSVGQGSEYTVELHLKAVNQGPDAASQVSLLSEELSGGFVTRVEPADWNCTPETFTVTCQRPDLPVGSSPEVVIRVRLPALFFENAIKNRISLSSETPDPDERNNGLILIVEFPGRSKLYHLLLPLLN